MKNLITTIILLAILAPCTTIMAQTQQEEYLGLPGDNLNLYAVMKLFQESETLEGFERNLNDENSRINNLDLNGDNFVDYLSVVDFVDGDVHNIVLQVAINKKETQDVAVFIVQRYSNEQVQIQLIGDEALYGRNYIIEPVYDDQLAGQTPNPGYIGNSGNIVLVRTTRYEIATWPVIRFIYLPSYVVWRSTWYWNYYPSYWHPWRPYYWHYYYGYHYNWYNNYYSHYRRWHYPRYIRWNDFYYSSKRSHSRYVSARIRSGNYKATYSQPNQRRHGEALFVRTNTNQSTRRAYQSSGNSTARRSGTQLNQNRQSAGTNTSAARRTTNTMTRSATNQTLRQNTSSAKRSATVINKSATNKPVTTRASSSSRRSSGSSKSGTISKSRSTKKPATTRASSSRSRSSGSSKSGTISKSKSTKKQATTRASSSSRRSSGSTKSGTISKNRSTSKPAGSTKISRRK